jgi:hypothetical protein
MRENDRGEVFVAGLHRESVTSVDDVLRMLERGSMCRSVGATLMNVTSSRSHAVFSIFVDQRAKPVAAVTAEEGAAALPPPPPVEAAPLYKTARFNLVDLAGSEKVKKTAAAGQVLQEAKMINKSLSALGNVINALTTGACVKVLCQLLLLSLHHHILHSHSQHRVQSLFYHSAAAASVPILNPQARGTSRIATHF